MLHRRRLQTLAVAAVLVSSHAAAQTTYRACRVPGVGAIYMIGVSGAPSACLESSHVEFSWTEGGSVAPGSIGTTELADGGVGASDLADGAVEGAKLADSSVSSAKVVDGSLELADFASDIRLPLAWGVVAQDGTLVAGSSSVVSVTPWNPFDASYYIELSFAYDPASHLVFVTPFGFENVGVSATVSDDLPPKLAVHIWRETIGLSASSFYFMVF